MCAGGAAGAIGVQKAVDAAPDGSMLHFSGELVKKQAGLSITHVPYRGAGNIGSDLVSSAIEVAFLGPGAAKPFIDAGRIVPIAMTRARHIALMPDDPALGEHPALKAYDLRAWYALMAPRGVATYTPDRLQRALRETLKDAAWWSAVATRTCHN